MKILIMVMVLVLVGCVDKESEDYVYHCSHDAEIDIFEWNESSIYTVENNTCNSIVRFQILSDEHLADNPHLEKLVTVTKDVQAVESENKQVQIHYEPGLFWFAAKGALINNYAISYIYTYNYDSDYIIKSANGADVYIHGYDDLYKSIMKDGSHDLVMVEVRDLKG